MFNLKNINLLTFFAVFSLITMLTACSNSNDDPVLPVFDPAVAPQNVQVVSGDDNTTDVRNTISWTLDPAATDYVVYVSNTSGVTESSSVVDPSDKGLNYVTHSEPNDALAGNTYYYRVQAVSGDQSSILSVEEVTGTPQQSIATNALNDVAWNGTDILVAVGDSGVILSSPNGVADPWTDVSDVSVPESLKGLTWEDDTPQFLIVGAGLTVLTGDGTTWNKEDLSNLSITTTTDLEDVTWLGTGYIAVGQNGTIITSNIDGSVWAERASTSSNTLNGVASNGNAIVVAVGTNGAIVTSTDGGVSWTEQIIGNNNLNDITWDGNQFGVVGSDDIILTSANGVDWVEDNFGTPDINFVAASQWDSGVPTNPVLGAVGSAGTFVVSPDATTGFISVPTGTNEQLSGMTWVDDNVNPAYFVIVGNDGTVLTSQLQ